MQGLCSWAFSHCSWVGEIPSFLYVIKHPRFTIIHKNAGILLLGVFTLQLGRLDPCIFKCAWRLGCLITRKDARIVAFAVLGAFSVVLRAFGRFFGLLFPPLGGLPGPLGGLRGAFGGLLGALLRLLNAILTS